MSSIHVRLFGAPQVEIEGQVLPIPRRKTLALLAYLAATGRMHSRESLAALFWPEYDSSGALANLRRDLSRLKELLGEAVLSADRQQAGLDPGAGMDLDVATFRSLVDSTKQHGHAQGELCARCCSALTEAVELYRGDFLAGFHLPDSPGFDEWRFFQVEELRQLLAESLQRLISWQVSTGDYEQGVLYARRWLSMDRLHEPAHRSLMQLYAWSGQQAASLRQYEECRRLLREELGVEPEPETLEIYEKVRSRSLAPPVSLDPASVLLSGSGKVEQEIFSQEIRFCTARDGVRLAYATVGGGPVLVKAANWLSHLEHDWESPVWRHWLTGLARTNTLVRYDERGCGLSDWEVDEFNLDAWVLDLETVVDAMGLERFPLLGISQGVAIAVEYAVRHPEKVSRLVLYGGYLRGRLHRPLTPEQRKEMDLMVQLIRIGWGMEHAAFRQVFSSLFMPGGTPEQFNAFNELQRVSSTPEIAARIVEGFQSINVVDQARRVTQPALVLHARSDMRVPYAEGRLVAATIPNARLVSLESSNHILLEDEPAWKRFLEEVHAFLQAGEE